VGDGGDFWLSMLWESRRAVDLRRDRRILVHSIITSRDGGEGEFKVRGYAVAEQRPAVQARYGAEVAEHLGWHPTPGRFHLFRLDIQEVTFIRYDDPTGDQHLASWPPAREFIRRGNSETSLGDPEPVTDVVVPDEV
jgi:hypothetical protein